MARKGKVVATPPVPTGDVTMLDKAEKAFAFARVATGLTAVMYGYAEQNHLYVTAGFKTMSELAKARFGHKSDSAVRKAKRASEAVWTYYPDLCSQVLAAVANGESPLAAGFPAVPNEDNLEKLKRSVKDLGPEARDAVLASVLAGEPILVERPKDGRSSALAAHGAEQEIALGRIVGLLIRAESELRSLPGPLTAHEMMPLIGRLDVLHSLTAGYRVTLPAGSFVAAAPPRNVPLPVSLPMMPVVGPNRDGMPQMGSVPLPMPAVSIPMPESNVLRAREGWTGFGDDESA